MNSNALREKALGAIKRQGPKSVELFLNHDQSDRELTDYFRRELADVDVADRSVRYTGPKDLNESLIVNRQKAAHR